MAKRTKYAGANYDDDEKPIEIANDDFQDHEEVTRNNQRIAQERAARPNITTKPIGEEWNESEVKAIEAAAEAKRAQDAMKERVASAQKALGIYKPTKEERAAEQREAWNQHLRNTDERIETMRQNEEDRRDRWHSQLEDARDRRLKSVMKIAAAEPGRYGGIAHKAAVDYLQREEAARRFDTEQDTTRKVSENEMNGKINYGKGAAEVKAGADVTMNKNEWETRAKIAEQEAAARKYLADQDAAVKRDISKNRDGWWDDQGNFHPGASVKEAEAGGTWRLEQQKLKNQGNADVQELKNKGTETQANATVEAARERQKGIGERRAQQDALREQKDFETWIANQTALDPSKRTITSEEANQLKTMPIEEQKEFWKQKTGRQDGQQNDVVTDSKGTKWQVIYDENGKPVGKKPIK